MLDSGRNVPVEFPCSGNALAKLPRRLAFDIHTARCSSLLDLFELIRLTGGFVCLSDRWKDAFPGGMLSDIVRSVMLSGFLRLARVKY